MKCAVKIVVVLTVIIAATFVFRCLDKPEPEVNSEKTKPKVAEHITKPSPVKSKPKTDTPVPVIVEPSETETPKTDEPETDSPAFTNQRFGWNLINNLNHASPGIPEDARIIFNYNGLYLGDSSQNKVYLTFDEGYENGYTSRILDSLAANKVAAAFFVTRSYIEKNPEIIKRMVREGHQVCNHTATHPSLPSSTDEQIKNEIDTTAQAFHDLTGSEMSRYLRPPSGEYSDRVLYTIQKAGYKTVFWSMAYRDWEVDKQPGAEYAYNYVMTHIHPGAIILLHAVSSSNTEALDRIIKDLKSSGYSFARLP
ncbi:MAG: delta-lactam-biosynthetic de-N-acetylase [Chitinophagales bacterium]